MSDDPRIGGGGSDVTDFSFEDLFDLQEIQAIQDAFASATGVASIITHIDGTPITEPSNFCRLCSDIIRNTDTGLKNCFKSDAVIGRFNPEGPIIQPCLSGGLWDGGANIHVGGQHIANWLIGQVRNDAQDTEAMLEYARTIGADENDFRCALDDVTVMPLEQFQTIGKALFLIANLLSDTAFKNAQLRSQGQNLEALVRDKSADLAASEERHRQIVENISDWVWEVDENARYTFASAKVKDILGYDPEEIVGKTPFELMPEDEADRVSEVFSAYVEQNKPFSNLENTNRHKNGKLVVLETSGVPQFDAEGRFTGYLGIDRDITARKDNEAQLLRFTEAMVGREKRILEVKREVNNLCRECNRETPYAEESDGSVPFPHWHPRGASEGDPEEGLSNVRELFDPPTLQKTLQLFCSMTGVASAVIDLEGEIIAQANWQRICTDFHRVNEETCKRCVESDTSIANQLTAGKETAVYHCRNGLTDVATPIVINGEHIANAFVGQFFVSKPDEASFHGQAQRFGFDEDDYMGALKEVPIIDEEKLPQIVDLLAGLAEISVAMGRQQLQNRKLTESLTTQGEVTLSLLEDARLSEQKAQQAAAETEKVNEKLSASNEELEQFAYVASHDLQEPLRMVASYTELLARRYEGKLDEAADEFIGFAVDGAMRMQGLINDLLAYSRVGTQAEPPAPVDCNEIMSDLTKDLEMPIEESGAEIVVGDLPTVMADRARLRQVFQNLITNAVRYRSEAPPRVEISANRRGSRWEICVADNGIGIDPKFHKRVFVIFQRLHDRGTYPGTGIGLAIVKKIIEQHGGEIRLESVVGEGSRFFFTLPAAEPAPEEPDR